MCVFIGTGPSLLVYLPLSPFISVNVSTGLQPATCVAAKFPLRSRQKMHKSRD